MSTIPGELMRSVAQDLTALPDPDLIITGLVRRVRSTLGCDLAYLSLNDPDTRETRIRFSAGVRTADYASISMPIGTGVLGMAAAGVTTESPDYLPDLAKLHIEAVDIAVNIEGVRAILGTPLRIGGEVIGALTVANRFPGGFSPWQRAQLEEAALIGSAAVEIHLLRHELAKRQNTFKEELAQRENDASISNRQLQLVMELAPALAAGLGTTELIAIASQAIGGTVRLTNDGNPEEPHATVMPLEPEGSIDFLGEDSQAVEDLAPLIATFVSISLTYEHAIEDARHFKESELVERLVDPLPHMSGRPIRTGLPGAGELDVFVAEVGDPLSLRESLAQVRRKLGTRAISASRRGNLIVIGRTSDELFDRVHDSLRSSHYYGGVATASTETKIAQAYIEASLVAKASRSLKRKNELARRTDLGVVAFAIGGTTDNAEGFVKTQLARISGNSERERILRETALSYLDARGSVSSVAAELGAHENTIRQRLGRLDQLLPGWREGPHSLDIHVALRANTLLTYQ